MRIATLTPLLLAFQPAYSMPNPNIDTPYRQSPKRLSTTTTTHPQPPYPIHDTNTSTPTPQFTCSPLAYGLLAADCQHMASIGMHAQGRNDLAENGRIWIGSDGANTFTFINASPANISMTLIVWYAPADDDQASFMNARQPQISYSLPERGSAVEVSASNGVPGAWAALYGRRTGLTRYGQVDNTFGEFSSGRWATADVSRLVNMGGDGMVVRVYDKDHSPRGAEGDGDGGGEGEPLCVSDMQTCAYVCGDEGASSCGETGSYKLVNCQGPNAEQSADVDGNPTGGCQGWSFGGHLEVILS